MRPKFLASALIVAFRRQDPAWSVQVETSRNSWHTHRYAWYVSMWVYVIICAYTHVIKLLDSLPEHVLLQRRCCFGARPVQLKLVYLAYQPLNRPGEIRKQQRQSGMQWDFRQAPSRWKLDLASVQCCWPSTDSHQSETASKGEASTGTGFGGACFALGHPQKEK